MNKEYKVFTHCQRPDWQMKSEIMWTTFAASKSEAIRNIRRELEVGGQYYGMGLVWARAEEIETAAQTAVIECIEHLSENEAREDFGLKPL